MRQRTVSRRTNHLLSRLTRVTFESQLPPTLIAIVLLFIYTIRVSLSSENLGLMSDQ